MSNQTTDTTAAVAYSGPSHTLGGHMGITLRNHVIASALLAFAVICVIAAFVMLGADEPYALAAGVALVALVKADDARIRRQRRRAQVLTAP